jgi:hypothetical protein
VALGDRRDRRDRGDGINGADFVRRRNASR